MGRAYYKSDLDREKLIQDLETLTKEIADTID
jgi:hypothetical protein